MYRTTTTSSSPSSDFMSCPVSKAYNLDDLRYDKQYRCVGDSDRRPVVAIDTETDNGNIFLLADSDGNYIEYPDITFESVVRFLFRHEYKWIFCWNLGFDGDVIAKLLGDVLNRYKETGNLTFDYKTESGQIYKISYIENKTLTISKGHHSVSIYDAAQYYDKVQLVDAYEKNIKRPVQADYLAMKKDRDIFTKRYYRDHKKQVRNYCITDCILTKELAEHFVGTYHDSFGLYLNKWPSGGYLAEKTLIYNRINIPLFYEIEYPIQKMARACFYGGRFEMVQKGFVGKAYDYDINSAYPYALTTIPDLMNGRWEWSDTLNPDARLGFFHIIGQVHSSIKIAPFPFRTKYGMILYPFGKFETYVTLPELLAVQALGSDKIRFRVLEGCQFIPRHGDEDTNYIFRDFVIGLYRRRQLLKEQKSPLERAIKLVLNSSYGKTAQKTKKGRGKPVMGNLFCPVIAAHTTGFTRAQLFTTVNTYGLQEEITAFATDSITTMRPLPGIVTNDLGGMKLADSCKDLYSIQNGFRRSNGNWKLRGLGFDKEKNVAIEHVNTIETPDGRVVLVLERQRPQRLKSAILRGKIKEIGKFKMYKKEIDLNADRKRFWPERLTTVHSELCVGSMPLDINLDGRLYAKESGLVFSGEQEDYNPYDNAE